MAKSHLKKVSVGDLSDDEEGEGNISVPISVPGPDEEWEEEDDDSAKAIYPPAPVIKPPTRVTTDLSVATHSVTTSGGGTAHPSTTVIKEVAASMGKSDLLPIDGYREQIIARINRDRVCIIHGETGCGKRAFLLIISCIFILYLSRFFGIFSYR